MAELPPVAAIKRAIPDSVRQEAALPILQDYIEGLTGKNFITANEMPVAAHTRWNEYRDEIDLRDYQRTHVRMGNAPVSREAQEYVKNSRFRAETLSKFVSKQFLEAYQASPAYRKLVAEQTAVAEKAAATQAADAERGAVMQAVDRDRDAKHPVDWSVFGIELGKPLQLPSCPPSNGDSALLEAFNLSTVANTCLVDKASSPMQLFAQLAAISSTVPWVTSGIPVKLAHSKCPDWVTGGCIVTLNVQSGIPLGAFFQTKGVDEEDTIKKALVKKYHNPPKPGGQYRCFNQLTGITMNVASDMYWDMPGLYVSYYPIDNCPGVSSTIGKIVVELPQLRRLRSKAQKEHEDKQPSM